MLWRLISTLSLNHLSLADTSGDALRELLRLHNTTDSLSAERQIDGLVGLRTEPAFARVTVAHGMTFARGRRLDLEFDEEQFPGGGMFLMASVLERFFALYASMNSFTQVAVRSAAAPSGGPMAGPRRLADPVVFDRLDVADMSSDMSSDDSPEGLSYTTTYLETPAREQARRRLEAVIEREGSSFEFFQLIRLLQRMYPDRDAVGGWSDPRGEVARMHVPPTLSFPPSEISAVELTPAAARRKKDERSPAHVGVRFLGLTGPQGVLPHGYTEYAAARARVRDTAFRDFIDSSTTGSSRSSTGRGNASHGGGHGAGR